MRSNSPSPPSSVEPAVASCVPCNRVIDIRSYTTTYFCAKPAVADVFGVWFETRRTENTWEATRPTRTSLKLKDWLLKGVKMAALSDSSSSVVKRGVFARLHPTLVSRLLARKMYSWSTMQPSARRIYSWYAMLLIDGGFVLLFCE